MGVGMLMSKITAIEAFLEHRPPTSVKPIINNPEVPRKICTNCKLKGHLAPECWGRCIHCARFGHKSQVCRSRPPQPQGARPQPQEPVKKTDGKKSKGGKKKNKEKSKRIAELPELINSPDISESDSESDSNINEAVNRVQIQSPRAGPSPC